MLQSNKTQTSCLPVAWASGLVADLTIYGFHFRINVPSCSRPSGAEWHQMWEWNILRYVRSLWAALKLLGRRDDDNQIKAHLRGQWWAGGELEGPSWEKFFESDWVQPTVNKKKKKKYRNNSHRPVKLFRTLYLTWMLKLTRNIFKNTVEARIWIREQ